MERFLRPLPLLGLAFAARAVLALWTETIAADGAFHLMTAQGLLDGRFGELLAAWRLHPLNPILTAALGAVLGGVEAGGAAVGVVLSSLALLPLYALARRYWNEGIAGWTGLVYALHPPLLEECTEVLNTGTYLFLFLGALAAGTAALETRRWRLFALCGAACGLLYLTRPEGLLVPGLLGLLALGRLRAEPRRVLLGGLLAAAVALLVALPYLLWLRSYAGRWVLTARGAAHMLVQAAPEAPSEPRRNPSGKILKTFLKAQSTILAPLLALGIAVAGRLGGSRRCLAWAGGTALLTFAPSILVFLKSGTVPPSHRYFLPGIALLLPWTAAGLLFLKTLAGRFGAAPLVLVLGALVAKGVGPRRAEEATFRQTGAWIRTLQLPPGARVVSRGEKIPWYAGLPPQGIHFGHPEDPIRDVVEAHRLSGATLFALDGDTRQRYLPPDAEERLRAEGFVLERTFEGPSLVPVHVYRRKPPP